MYLKVNKSYSNFNDSLAKNEKNDCVVRSIASACNVSYRTAHTFCKENFNLRKENCYDSDEKLPVESSPVKTKYCGQQVVKNYITRLYERRDQLSKKLILSLNSGHFAIYLIVSTFLSFSSLLMRSYKMSRLRRSLFQAIPHFQKNLAWEVPRYVGSKAKQMTMFGT